MLLEEFGTYLISETEVKNMQLTKDQVTTYSAGIVSAEVIEEKWDGKTYWLKAKVSADPKEAQKTLKKIVDDKYKAKELEETRKKAEELTEEVERLKLLLAKTETIKKQPSKKIEHEYNAAIQEFTAIEWFNRGLIAGMAAKWENAKDYFSKAIELKSDYTVAYYNRGTVYAKLGNYQQAITDFTKAVELKPDDAKTYNNRGLVYFMLGNYQHVIRDYNKVIELNPDNAKAYYILGVAYGNIGNYQQAIKALKVSARLGVKEAQDMLLKFGEQW
ncbi:tetratricopeptide repeat protein [Dissulfurispira sp.]|uniref:tetratricopeptide repeat protein n=1 Tax=Dissulfurispira sp. TaxID=2817609 RepID=UPI002FDA9355